MRAEGTSVPINHSFLPLQGHSPLLEQRGVDSLAVFLWNDHFAVDLDATIPSEEMEK